LFVSRLSVLDEDAVGADYLGEYRFKLSTIKSDVKETYSVYLQHKTEVSERKENSFSLHIFHPYAMDTYTFLCLSYT
jgi:hypothetical protein